MTDPQAEWTKTPPTEPPAMSAEEARRRLREYIAAHGGRMPYVGPRDGDPILPEPTCGFPEPLKMPEPPKEDRLSRLSPEMRAAFEESWEQNREAYDYLAKNDGPEPPKGEVKP